MQLVERFITRTVLWPYCTKASYPTTARWVTIVATETPKLGASDPLILHRAPSSAPTTLETGVTRDQVGGIVVGVGGLIVLIALLWCCLTKRRHLRTAGISEIESAWPTPYPPSPRPIRPPRPPSPKYALQPGFYRPARPHSQLLPPQQKESHNFTSVSHVYDPEPHVQPVNLAVPESVLHVHSKLTGEGTSQGDLPGRTAAERARLRATKPRPRRAIAPELADKAYDKAQYTTAETKKGRTFAVGGSINEAPKAVGFLRRAKDLNLSREPITKLEK
jgi:hypothetical protein